MAHFGVKKAKLLALAGAIAIAGAGIMSAGNASAIEDFSTLSRGTDYDCGTEGNYYTITMHTAKAVKWTVKDSTKFYSPSTTNCYVDWKGNQESFTPLVSQVKIYIDGGEYTFDEKVTRDDGTQNPTIIIKDSSNVIFKASTDEGGLYDDSDTYRLSFNVEEGGSLTFDSGTYAMYINNEGTITFNSGNYDYMSLNNYGTVTINDGNFTTDDAEGSLGSHLSNQNQSAVMTVKGGNFDVENHIYPININPAYFHNAGTLNIEGGTFKYDFTNEASNTTDGAASRIGTDEMPYYGDPGAFIRNSGGVVNISGGDFGGANSGKGTLINQYGSSSDTKTTISGGNFEVESMITTLLNNDETSSPTKVEVTGGTFNTRKSFFLADYSGIPEDQCAVYDSDACTTKSGLWRDSSGNVRSGYMTGPNISAPYFLGATAEKGIKGGDFSDSENIWMHMPSNSDTIDLDTDYDGDGNNDVRVLEKIPNSPFGITVDVDEQKTQNLGDPGKGSWRIYSIKNDEHCTATISGNQITITGVIPTNGDQSQFCKVTAVSDAKIAVFSVSVNKEESYVPGEPFGLSVGDTKTPDDFDGNPEDYEWAVLLGGDYCSVNDQGQVTAKMAGGVCYIGAHDPEAKETTYWEIHTTEPLDMEVGDSKKPSDLPEGAEDGEWSSDNTEVCTVAEDGTITAKKAGTCHVTLRLDDGSVYTWTVNIKANPNTADSMKAITFSVAGAMIAGFGAMVAVAKRFIRR